MTDAFAGGGIVKLSTDQLNNFANDNLGSFITGLQGDYWTKAVGRFAEGVPSGGPPGATADNEYYQVLPGNTQKGQLIEASTLQQGVKTLTGKVNDQISQFLTKAKQLQLDLHSVGNVVANADDRASVTAAEMTADTGNIGPFTGSSGTGSGGTGSGGTGSGGTGSGGTGSGGTGSGGTGSGGTGSGGTGGGGTGGGGTGAGGS